MYSLSVSKRRKGAITLVPRILEIGRRRLQQRQGQRWGNPKSGGKGGEEQNVMEKGRKEPRSADKYPAWYFVCNSDGPHGEWRRRALCNIGNGTVSAHVGEASACGSHASGITWRSSSRASLLGLMTPALCASPLSASPAGEFSRHFLRISLSGHIVSLFFVAASSTAVLFTTAMVSDREDDTLQDGLDAGGLFDVPEGYYPPEKEPTYAEHKMLSGQTVRVRLVGSHPLYVRNRMTS